MRRGEQSYKQDNADIILMNGGNLSLEFIKFYIRDISPIRVKSYFIFNYPNIKNLVFFMEF